ncbi:MAG TPA: hypothetical protein VG754_09780 [Verrucomicrobiae bacterium]|nr:hypothetical protein [Verrucomicrobiae bacterium]
MACVVTTRADVLELTNGDHYRGNVLSMNANSVEFQSEVLGRIVLPRSKVATVTLHEVIAKPAANTKTTAMPYGSPIVVAATNASVGVSTAVVPGSQADTVVRELRKQGVDPKLIDQVQEQIFGKSSPEAAQKFNELMGGLLSGQVSVGDIRKQAQRSINDIKAAKKELGPDAGEMLDSYLGILEKFVQEAGADSSSSTPVIPPSPSPQAAPLK